MIVANLFLYLPDGDFDKLGHFPVAGAFTNLKGKVPEHFLALRGVNHFGVKLHAKDIAVEILYGRIGTVLGFGYRFKTVRHGFHLVAVAFIGSHPDTDVTLSLRRPDRKVILPISLRIFSQ